MVKSPKLKITLNEDESAEIEAFWQFSGGKGKAMLAQPVFRNGGVLLRITMLSTDQAQKTDEFLETILGKRSPKL